MPRARQWADFVRDELETDGAPSLSARLRLLRRGYHGNRAWLYDLKQHALEDYAPDVSRVRMAALNRGFFMVSKLPFAALLGAYPQRVPHRIAMVDHGRVTSLDAAGSRTLVDLATELARGERDFVIKPVRSHGGRGVAVGSFEEGRLVLHGVPEWSASPPVDPDTHAIAVLARHLSARPLALVERRVAQHPMLARLFAGSTNTVRALVLRDEEGPFLAAATLRLGRERSRPVDNFAAGGLSVGIDATTGRLSDAVMRGDARGPGLMRTRTHPDSGAPITGETLPHWERLRRGVLELSDALPFVRLGGWDLVITHDDFVALELNTIPQLGMQVNGPLLVEPRTRRFFEGHGLL